VILPIAYGIAVAATLLLIRHVARRYPSAPARVPLSIGMDGRPSKRSAPKALLWLAPGLLVPVLIFLAIPVGLNPPDERVHVVFALMFLTFAEIAWYIAWITDRQIELARKMSYRVAPVRIWWATVPILVTVAATVAIVIRL
jgi:hypothetical protein